MFIFRIVNRITDRLHHCQRHHDLISGESSLTRTQSLREMGRTISTHKEMRKVNETIDGNPEWKKSLDILRRTLYVDNIKIIRKENWCTHLDFLTLASREWIIRTKCNSISSYKKNEENSRWNWVMLRDQPSSVLLCSV